MSAFIVLTILDTKNGGQGSVLPLLDESGSAQHRHLAVLKILKTAIGGFGESAKKTACAKFIVLTNCAVSSNLELGASLDNHDNCKTLS